MNVYYGEQTFCFRLPTISPAIDEFFPFSFSFSLGANLSAMLCIGSYEVTANLSARYVVGSPQFLFNSNSFTQFLGDMNHMMAMVFER